MDNNTKSATIHPLTAAAAVAVILVSLTGIAAMTGLLPSFTKNTEPDVSAANQAITASDSASQPVADTTDTTDTATTGAAPVVTANKKTPAKKSQAVASPPVPDNTTPASGPAGQSVAPPAPPLPCLNCGVVESVRAIQQQAPASGLGAATGALLGGVLGHQVGGGNGKALATIAGAVGGGFAGNAVEKNASTSIRYEVIVRMDDGSRQRFILKEQRWSSGDPVRIDNGNLSRRN